MPARFKLTKNERDLIRRYLVWCYKTTKESLDRVDRKFTQLKVDCFVLEQLLQSPLVKLKGNPDYEKFIREFEQYIKDKREEAVKQKFNDPPPLAGPLSSGQGFKKALNQIISQQFSKASLKAEYVYLINRFTAIERAIKYFLGHSELQNFRIFYEQEMTQRIVQSREHT